MAQFQMQTFIAHCEKSSFRILCSFPEFVLDSTMANAAGFQHLAGPIVTVLSSKTSQRYRLQVGLTLNKIKLINAYLKKSQTSDEHTNCTLFERCSLVCENRGYEYYIVTSLINKRC